MDHRLRENAIVTLSPPASGPLFRVSDFRALVIALLESGVALEPLDVATAALPSRAEDVFLSFVHAGQLVGLKGTLTWNESGRGLRFQVQDGVHVRRRGYTRVDAELPVTLRPADAAEPCHGTTVNVAPEGLLVAAPLAVELGDVLEIGLTLRGGDPPLRLRGKVVRHAGGMIALHFVGDRRDSRAAVAEFVVERRARQLHGVVA